ncbi:hypothetical protein C7999DRAFT_15027 [Corynascus novoguineensis]|uniref:DNA polymerase lambda n=1 Tax=Corynascus novoguineensis TaxID=1126955 RepID=A0AAN7CT63_9PEZI|nr:hypothetical protein C7999DRAFT_15027 [Corynascus novoguineensis]
MKSLSLGEKIAFFDQLDALDHVSDGDDEIDEKERDHRNKCRAFFSSRKRAGSSKEIPPIYPPRTTSISTPAAAMPNQQVIEATPATQKPAVRHVAGAKRPIEDTTPLVEETPVPDTARPTMFAALKRSRTLPTPSSAVDQSPSTSTALRKRKRQPSTKSVPESAQIFRGLAFYYIPNNDIAPARKLRIGKAQDYGAKWVRDLADATHAIVDKHLEYKDIQSIVGPNAGDSLVIVNEEYPIDCISFRVLLNPKQIRYRVRGSPGVQDEVLSDPAVPDPSLSSDGPMQVKAPRTSTRQNPRHTSPGCERPPPQNNPRGTQRDVADKDLFTISDDRSEAHTSEADLQGQSGITGHKTPPPPPPSPQRSDDKDDLSEYIELLQQYKDLPLDEEEDDLQPVYDAQDATSDSDIELGSADERAHQGAVRSRRTTQKAIPFEERFACTRGGTRDKSADAQNPNAKTIEVLQRMCDYYTRINDTWRTLAYRKAITTLRRQPTRITTEEEAFRLPNIGRHLAAKIEEIACTNRLRRLEYANDEPLDRVLELFLNIYDVGLSRANKWIAQGYRTLDDLRLKADLTPNQRLSIEHYDDLNARIPRDEVTALFSYVRREAAQIDSRVELLVGGSYRRGAQSSGDIDIIVTRKGTDSSAELVPFLEELVSVLTRKGFLVATLAALHAYRPGKDGPGSKWHGCCVWRRIDFLLVPESEYGAALIYFTGNDIFNRSMRLLASKKGMRLNQRGLYKEVLGGKDRTKVTEGQLLEGRDEKRIFELLGVKWREPWERWC